MTPASQDGTKAGVEVIAVITLKGLPRYLRACRLLGFSTMLLAVSNVFVGLCVGRPTGLHKFVAGYTAYIAVILAAALAGTCVNYCSARKAEKQFLQAKH